MSQAKTQESQDSVSDFIASVDNPARREDADAPLRKSLPSR